MADKEILILNAAEISEKIKAAQELAGTNPELCGEAVYRSAEDIVYNICRVVYGRDDRLPYEGMLTAADQSGVIPPFIAERLKRIPAYAAVSSNPNIALFELEKIVRWYFQDFLQIKIPETLSEFVVVNHDLPEGSPPELAEKTEASQLEEKPEVKLENPEPGESEPKNGLEFIKSFIIPDYARRLIDFNSGITATRNKDAIKRIMLDINNIYELVGLRDDISRALFFLLCSRTVQNKKPVSIEPFAEYVLKWSMSNAAKNIYNFPSTELTLRTTLENVITQLKERGIVDDREFPGYGRMIALQQVDKQQATEEKSNIKKLLQLISEEMQKATENPAYPYPSLRSVIGILKQDKIDPSPMCPNPVFYREMDEQTLRNTFTTKIISIEYSNPVQDYILATPLNYRSIPATAAQKIYQYFIRILPERGAPNTEGTVLSRINTILRKNFPNDNKDLQNLLSPDRMTVRNLWTTADTDLNYWLFIFKELNENMNSILKINNAGDRAIIQSVSLMFQIILARRERQKEREDVNSFKDNLIKTLETKDKVTRDQIKAEWTKKFYPDSAADSDLVEQKFADFMNSLLDEYSLRKKPESFLVELPTISPRTRVMEFCYTHSKNLLDLYKINLNALTDRQNGVKETAFVQRLTSVIQENQWANDTQSIIHALDSDDEFAIYLTEYIRNFYNELYVIDQLFETNHEMLLYLLKVREEKTSKYFNANNIKRSLPEMTGVTLIDILKQMRSRDDFMTRIINFFLNLFPFFRRKAGARIELLNILEDQFKTYGRGMSKRHDIPRINEQTPQPISRQEPTGNDKSNNSKKSMMDMLFKPRTSISLNDSKADKKAGHGPSDMDAKLRGKVSQFKKALLKKEGYTSETEYQAYFLKKWSMKPTEDEKIIQELMYRKDVNQNMSWLASIRRDLGNMATLDEFMDAVTDAAKAVATAANKKHINISHLTAYLAMYVLISLEKSL